MVGVFYTSRRDIGFIVFMSLLFDFTTILLVASSRSLLSPTRFLLQRDCRNFSQIEWPAIKTPVRLLKAEIIEKKVIFTAARNGI
jgi:hypothetical protein